MSILNGRSYRENCQAGLFIDATKVLSDGVMHYNEDGTKRYFENENIGKVMWYDENGIVEYTCIKDKNHSRGDISTEFYGDENSVVSNVYNYSKDRVTINANGQDVALGINGKISFYEDGQVSKYSNTLNESTIIKSKNTNIVVDANTDIEFYENGSIESIKNEKMYKSFDENGQLRTVKNYQKDEIISEHGYKLKERQLR